VFTRAIFHYTGKVFKCGIADKNRFNPRKSPERKLVFPTFAKRLASILWESVIRVRSWQGSSLGRGED
jgi:hypothetical protein